LEEAETIVVWKGIQTPRRGKAPLRRAGPSATPSPRKERSDASPEGKGHSSLRDVWIVVHGIKVVFTLLENDENVF